MKPFQSIRSLLVHPKDKHKQQDARECVYKIPCKNCNKTDIGKWAELSGYGYRNTDKKLHNVMWECTLKTPADLPQQSKTSLQSQTTFAKQDDSQPATCSQCSCPSRIRLRQVRSRTDRFPASCFCTGWMSMTGLGSGCAFKCTSVDKAWLPDTWSISASQSPALTVVGICNLQAMVSCRFHRSRWQPKKTVLLDMPVHLLGTLCQILSDAVHTVYLLSNVI